MSKIYLNLNSLDKITLKLFELFILKSLNYTKIKHSIIHLPKKKKRVTLLKSPHVYKSAREQFEIKYYKTVIVLDNKSILHEHINTFLINKPKNIKVSIKIKNI